MDEAEESSSTALLRGILRELPRKRVAFVVLVALVHTMTLVAVRGRGIGRERAIDSTRGCHMGVVERNLFEDYMERERLVEEQTRFVPPWEWTAEEWTFVR